MSRIQNLKGYLLVECHGGSEERVEHVRIVVELLVDHEGKDTHLGGAAVVELDGELLGDGLVIPAGLLELDSLDLVLAGGIASLDEGDGEQGAEDGLRRKVREGGKAGLGVGEVVSRGDGGRKAVASSGHEVAEDGKHGDAAMLGLDKAKAVELLLVSVSDKAERVPETKRRLGADLGLEGHLQGRRASGADRGEGRGTDEGSNDGKSTEHFGT